MINWTLIMFLFILTVLLFIGPLTIHLKNKKVKYILTTVFTLLIFISLIGINTLPPGRNIGIDMLSYMYAFIYLPATFVIFYVSDRHDYQKKKKSICLLVILMIIVSLTVVGYLKMENDQKETITYKYKINLHTNDNLSYTIIIPSLIYNENNQTYPVEDMKKNIKRGNCELGIVKIVNSYGIILNSTGDLELSFKKTYPDKPKYRTYSLSLENYSNQDLIGIWDSKGMTNYMVLLNSSSQIKSFNISFKCEYKRSNGVSGGSIDVEPSSIQKGWNEIEAMMEEWRA